MATPSSPLLDSAFLDDIIHDDPLLGQNPNDDNPTAEDDDSVDDDSDDDDEQQMVATKEVEVIVAASEVRSKFDIICIRGIHSSIANIMFRHLITSNKRHFDTLNSEEKDTFVLNLWLQLKEKGYQFLKTTEKHNSLRQLSNSAEFEVFNHDKSCKKVLSSLKHNRGAKNTSTTDTDAVTVEALLKSFDFEEMAAQMPSNKNPPKTNPTSSKKDPPAKKPKKVKFKPGSHFSQSQPPLPEKKFDDVAKEAISTLLSRQEFVDAMEKNWGDEIDQRRQICEENLLKRYKLAASNGLSIEQFQNRLLPVLLEEVGAHERNNCDEEDDKENAVAATEDNTAWVDMCLEEHAMKEQNTKSPSPQKEDLDQKPKAKATKPDTPVTFTCPTCNEDFTYKYLKSAHASFARHTRACKG